ncbi:MULTISPECIES: 3-isopropylmalate dehydratase [Bacteroidota]|uniref:3-isopropylmalate dehydratase n=1 Tax=Bacteroidota TaxID=976 RepID=UPI001CBECBFC|nr:MULTISPECIES: 3-isopropylmalate dehydratase [Bacteroidota]MBZ4190815.1 3-isopropylmalate dehydratase [Niabella beijingensis]UMQ40794.1 3-isopropylmalate dehydratase [Chryseobacterium sp. Y16C]
MKIRNNKGQWIEVTDLNKAIRQAGWYKTYQHNPPVESDKERQAYWADMHEKLKALKTKKFTQVG